MALLLEQLLITGDTVRYHRISKFYTNGAGEPAKATLESFRTQEQRGIPIQPVIKRDYHFIWSGSSSGMAEEAYTEIKKLPEWVGAADI